MLSESYKKWFSAGRNEMLPDFIGGIDDDWQVLFSSRVNKDGLYPFLSPGVSAGDGLPEIRVIPEDMEEEWQVNVLNSDLYHRGRMLQCLKTGNAKLPVGKYSYFNGRILLENGR
jgi:hypothetical protein